jgi:beta-glucosidase
MNSDNKKKPLPFQFPKKFMWGVATSAHQVEGDTHNQWSVWELENAKSLAKRAEYAQSHVPIWPEIKKSASTPDNYISGKATDHFNLYERDFDLVKKMNMNSFRFSVEWSRVEPKEGTWDAAALTHYKKYILALKARKIEPVVTLFHFSLPVWFTEKGGFEKRRNIKYFVRFAEKVLGEIGAGVRYIVTINEPEVYATQSYLAGNWPPNKTSRKQTLKVYINLARAHNRVAKMAHKSSRRYKVGLAKNVAYHYPGDDALLSRATAWVKRWMADDFFLRLVKRNLDWIGVNYYFSNRYYGYRMHNPNDDVSDLGWDMQPENIQHVLERLFVKYGKPIIITENGVADQNDEFRQWWITHTLMGMHRALQNGVPLEGYLHWSLFDNFEWAYGKWPRFGLFAVDYETGRRTPRKSAVWFTKLLTKLKGE